MPASKIRYRFRVQKYRDADTFVGDALAPITLPEFSLKVELTFSLAVRAYGFDACETTQKRKIYGLNERGQRVLLPIDAMEIEQGKKALAELQAASAGELLISPTGKLDVYGRTLALCYLVDGTPLADWMRERRFTRETFNKPERVAMLKSMRALVTAPAQAFQTCVEALDRAKSC